ncbi:MAG: hypothetical protein HY403_10925, partial [Elusimicrobia bacterium]|nr:hypothetical protein [Elusimicrobiota bacterium]
MLERLSVESCGFTARAATRAAGAAFVAAALAIGLLLARATGVTYDEPPYLGFAWAYLHGGPKHAVREYPPVLSYLRGAALAAAGAG